MAQIPADEPISSVGGDGAYDTKNAMQQSLLEVPMGSFRSTATDGRGRRMAPARLARNETLRTIKRLGRTIWKKWSGYHRRSLVETKIHCFKLLGQRVMARTFDRQITEIKVRVVILNRFSKIGTPNTVRVAQ